VHRNQLRDIAPGSCIVAQYFSEVGQRSSVNVVRHHFREQWCFLTNSIIALMCSQVRFVCGTQSASNRIGPVQETPSQLVHIGPSDSIECPRICLPPTMHPCLSPRCVGQTVVSAPPYQARKPPTPSGRKLPVKTKKRISSPICLPTKRDIRHMRAQIRSFKRGQVWNDGSDGIPTQKLPDAVEAPNNEVRRTLMITDLKPVDVRRQLQAAPLISTAGLIMDYIDVSHSLSPILREAGLSIPRQRTERIDSPRLKRLSHELSY
jgi:hypothetical protein